MENNNIEQPKKSGRNTWNLYKHWYIAIKSNVTKTQKQICVNTAMVEHWKQVPDLNAF